MSVLDRLLELFPGIGFPAGLPEDLRTGFRAWVAAPEDDPELPITAARFIVVDVETTGLDLSRDLLLAIGAVTVQDRAVILEQSFEVVLKQETASTHENILVHRIAGSEQMSGCDPAEALVAFLAFTGKSPLVGFHAHFDDSMLKRAFRKHLGVTWVRPWLDLAHLAPALASGTGVRMNSNPRNLDGWLDQFGIRVMKRHNAVADALGTAQLLQALASLAHDQGVRDVAALFRLARAYRWLPQ